MLKTLLSIFLIFCFGCGSSEKKEDNQKLPKLYSSNTVTEDSVRPAVYNFDELEPLLHKEDDKTYIVNFWATWCAPCIKELPHFERIRSEEQENGIEVLLVSLDMPKQWEKSLIPFIKKKKLRSKVVVLDDPKQNTWIPKVDENWSGAIPATLIYNKNKRSFYEQSFTYDELKENLDQFLKN